MTDNHRLSIIIESAKNSADKKILETDGNENDLHALLMAEFLIKYGIYRKDKSIECKIENLLLKSILDMKDKKYDSVERYLTELRTMIEDYFNNNAIESKGETL